MTTTAVETEPVIESSAACGFRPYRMNVDTYNRLVASGVLGDKSPIFLWKGRLVQKMTKARPHITVQVKLVRILSQIVPHGWYVEQDQPLELGDDSVPEPDLKIVRGDPDDFRNRNPGAMDVPLVMEVCDSSLRSDSREMLFRYAAASIPTYWIVNIPNGRIDVYTQPSGPAEQPAYAKCQSHGPETSVPVIVDGREVGRIAVKDVLP
jgi:Uma2 family endonuclease